MGRKKPEEPVIAKPGEPLRKCYDCIHWHMIESLYDKDVPDMSSGSCDHNGYSKCPPLFTCNGWASGNGHIYDKLKNN